MSQEEFEERRTSPAPIGHEFQKPIVEELRRDTPHSARERVNASEGDTSEEVESTADSSVSTGRHPSR